MLRNTLIVSLSHDYWDSNWRSRQQIMSRLAGENLVVFVSPPSTTNVGYRAPGVRWVNRNLCIYVPPRWLKVRRSKQITSLAEAGRRWHLKRFVKTWSQLPRIVYVWDPLFDTYVDHLKPDLVCYHIHDEFASYQKRHPRTADAHARMLERADCVITSSRELQYRYSVGEKTHWVPNGVDYDAFSRAMHYKHDLPADMRDIPKPILGYSGSLRMQIDIALLDQLALRKPQWSLVFVGDIASNTKALEPCQRLLSRKNVFALGNKSLEELPKYMAGFDVGLQPYILEGAGKFCYPLKMHEYIAAGLPVVSSALPAVAEFREVIRVAHSLPEWIVRIEQALLEKDPRSIKVRQAVAAKNTWDHRAASISNLLEKYFLEKRGIARELPSWVAPQLSVIMGTTAVSDVSAPVRDARPAWVESHEAAARDTTTVLEHSSNAP